MPFTRLVLAETREVRLGDGGIQLRKVGCEWPPQGLTYSDLAQLLDIKNEVFAAVKGDLKKGEKLFRAKVVKALTSQNKKSKAKHA